GAFAACLELADVELARGAHAPHVRERFAVGAEPRRHRSPLHADRGALAPGVQIAADDRVDGAVRVLVVLELLTCGDVLAVIEVAPVRRERGLARVFLEAVLVGDLKPIGSRGMEHPDLAGPERALSDEVPAREDKGAVRRPGGTVDPPA